jgi:hypothetical protein
MRVQIFEHFLIEPVKPRGKTKKSIPMANGAIPWNNDKNERSKNSFRFFKFWQGNCIKHFQT